MYVERTTFKRYRNYPFNTNNKKSPRDIRKDYSRSYIIKLIKKHIDVCLDLNNYLSTDTFNVQFILKIIIYLYNNNKELVDGANLAMTTVDKNIYGHYNSYLKKFRIKRDWGLVAEFVRKNNLVVVLRDCIFKYPRKQERKIQFLKYLMLMLSGYQMILIPSTIFMLLC